MAYASRSLNVLAYANGFTLWHYAAGDDGEKLETDGYFNPANHPWPTLKAGDIVLWSAAAGGGQLIVRDAAPHRVAVQSLVRTVPSTPA
ncbi:MAG: hypothetical protein U1E97_02630 [Alphaproteobacteria bacterium]